ncbi:methyltransferase [bacterium]|nr:methyltransferase [bacterium]
MSKKLESFIQDGKRNILIIGNPPWITNSALSMLNSANLPTKFNLKKHRGIDAITGKGNFDIAESIIFDMMKKFSHPNAKIAMLCKTSVIRNIVKSMKFLALEISDIRAYTIDSKKEFNICASAAVLVANFWGTGNLSCDIYSLYNKKRDKTFGWFNGNFVSNIEEYEKNKYIDGNSPFIWRSGVKHDSSKVMELRVFGENSFRNGLGEVVTLKNKELIYPFLKGSQLRKPVISETNKRIIITQSYPAENTEHIRFDYPEVWNYLSKHSDLLSKRKSSIYKGKSKFSIFGIGEYSFKPYKIAISALYEKPRFSLVLPFINKPVMLDDTCYFISFDNLDIAVYTWILLHSDDVYNLLSSIVFTDSKRPYTKEILMRIDLNKLVKEVSFDNLCDIYMTRLREFFSYDLNEIEYKNFIKTIKRKEKRENNLYNSPNFAEKLLV